MKRTIWKFPFQVQDLVEIEMPVGAEVLYVGLDPQRTPCLWALVEPERKKSIRKFRIVGTGHLIEDAIASMNRHLGSFVDGPFVRHVFDAWGSR